jgi:hypothetical protein
VKHGLIKWDKSELPPQAFESRLEQLREKLARADLPAALIYSDVWQSTWGRYYANFMPYRDRALIVVPMTRRPVLICSLPPHVYPWIKSVTIFKDIRTSVNLAESVLEMCAERGWEKIGTIGTTMVGPLPYDLAGALTSITVSLDWFPSPDRWARKMYTFAASMAREGLNKEIRKAPGLIDYEFVAKLERIYRRAGAEDVVIRLANGETPPGPACGAVITKTTSVWVAMEYRGHWVKIGQNASNVRLAQTGFSESPYGPMGGR